MKLFPKIIKGLPICRFPFEAGYNRICRILERIKGRRGIIITRTNDEWVISIDEVWLAAKIEAIVSPMIDSVGNESRSAALQSAGKEIITDIVANVAYNTTTHQLTMDKYSDIKILVPSGSEEVTPTTEIITTAVPEDI